MNPSGATLERASNCPASCALPQVKNTNALGTAGREKHFEIEVGLSNGAPDELPEVVKGIVDGAQEVDVEVAFALDVDACRVREIGRRLPYDQLGPRGESEIVVIIDAIVNRAGVTSVVDWKNRKRVTPAIRNLQIRASAVAVMHCRGLGMVEGVIAYLDDGEVDSHSFDSFDRQMFWEDMRAMLRRVRLAEEAVRDGLPLNVHTGPWCEYCPAMPHCPGHTRLALSMLGELSSVEKEIAFMSPEQVGKAWELLKQVQWLSERVEASLKLRAKQEVIPLPSGKRLAMVECKGRMGLDREAVKARYEALGEPLPMRRGANYTQTKEVG